MLKKNCQRIDLRICHQINTNLRMRIIREPQIVLLVQTFLKQALPHGTLRLPYHSPITYYEGPWLDRKQTSRARILARSRVLCAGGRGFANPQDPTMDRLLSIVLSVLPVSYLVPGTNQATILGYSSESTVPVESYR
jgi:hypothetical protein